jgi:hypothetical protein
VRWWYPRCLIRPFTWSWVNWFFCQQENSIASITLEYIVVVSVEVPRKSLNSCGCQEIRFLLIYPFFWWTSNEEKKSFWQEVENTSGRHYIDYIRFRSNVPRWRSCNFRSTASSTSRRSVCVERPVNRFSESEPPLMELASPCTENGHPGGKLIGQS